MPLYQLSIAYNSMRETPKNRQWEGTTLLGVGLPFHHCQCLQHLPI